MKSGRAENQQLTRWALWRVLVVFGVMATLIGRPAFGAEVYPSKPVAYTVFFPAGGRSDLTARLIAPYLQRYLSTPVIVTNVVGGAGLIGHRAVKDAVPDGYTLGQSGGTLNMQYTRPGMSVQDYAWIAKIYEVPYVIGVPASSPFKSLKELVEFARANPNKLKHGHSGHGLHPHLGSAAFRKAAGIQYTEVAYTGEGPVVIGVASGEVDLAFSLAATFRQMVEANKVRILAVCGTKRGTGQFDRVPTCKEQGYDFEWEAFELMFAPRALVQDRAVFAKISEAARKAILDPEFGQKVQGLGLEVAYLSGQELATWISQRDQKTKEVIFDLGLQYK